MYRLTEVDSVIRIADGAIIPNDPTNRDRSEYEDWLADGGVPGPYVEPPVPTPTTVTPRQARLALLQAGLLDDVEAAVNAAGGATKITWEYATEINRNDALIDTLGVALGLTSEQIDGLFSAAANL